MRAFLKEYFNFSKRENRGIILLLILIVLVFLTPTILNYFKVENAVDFSAFDSQLSQFETTLEINKEVQELKAIDYFKFDPNTINLQDLIKLGLSNNQAQTLINYRNAGGSFKKKEDLKKIYAIDDDLYSKLKPYIQIEKIENRKHMPEVYVSEREIPDVDSNTDLLIELNTADSIDLIKLPGIGIVLSRRIINYRNILGGYYTKDQLLEVFGLSNETFLSVYDYIIVDTLHIQKLNLNTIEFKALNKHPYFTYTHTKSIIKYRQLMGGFSSIDAILANHLVDSLTYAKIKNYVAVE